MGGKDSKPVFVTYEEALERGIIFRWWPLLLNTLCPNNYTDGWPLDKNSFH